MSQHWCPECRFITFHSFGACVACSSRAAQKTSLLGRILSGDRPILTPKTKRTPEEEAMFRREIEEINDQATEYRRELEFRARLKFTPEDEVFLKGMGIKP